MLSRMWLINGILVLLIGFLGLKAYGVWSQENKGFETPKMVQKPVQRVTKPLGSLQERKISPESEYNALMALNLFSPERTEIISDETIPDEKAKKISAVEQKKMQLNLKKLTLYGLVITDNSAEALVSQPSTTPIFNQRTKSIRKNATLSKKRTALKQTKWVKVGDSLGEFKVVTIAPDRILLEGGGQSYELLLYDKNKIRSHRLSELKTGPTVLGLTVAPPVMKDKGGGGRP